MQNTGLRFVYRKCGLLTYGNACKWGNKLGCWESQETWACRRESLEPRKSGTQPDNRHLPTSRGQNNSDKMFHDRQSVIYHISKVRYTAQSKFCAIHWNEQLAVNIFADSLIDAASVPLNLDQQCIERDGVWGRGGVGVGGSPSYESIESVISTGLAVVEASHISQYTSFIPLYALGPEISLCPY